VHDLADRLRALREARGLGVSELARRAGLSPRAVRLIETGKVADPGLGTAARLARALRVDLRALADDAVFREELKRCLRERFGMEVS